MSSKQKLKKKSSSRSFSGTKAGGSSTGKSTGKSFKLKAKKAKKDSYSAASVVPSMQDTSDPTALIAPSDYQHIFKGPKKDLSKAKQATDNDDPDPDAPTCLIGPEDYINYYQRDQKVVLSKKMNKVQNPVPDDAPTVLKEAILLEASNTKKNGSSADIGESEESQGCCCLIM